MCLIVYGAFNYIWKDMVMYYLFWCVFCIGSAALRISKREHDDNGICACFGNNVIAIFILFTQQRNERGKYLLVESKKTTS